MDRRRAKTAYGEQYSEHHALVTFIYSEELRHDVIIYSVAEPDLDVVILFVLVAEQDSLHDLPSGAFSATPGLYFVL